MSRLHRPSPVQRAFENALREHGIPYVIEVGKKHRKVMVNKRLVGIIPHGLKNVGNPKKLKTLLDDARAAVAAR